ncbi:MAG: glutamine synthetase [Deltaproteobacteria bacterium]|jgi:glutamine synthetase|nr:glutamine synthetase [Deltaproteobacteria bacterium]MBW2486329.1 glutamine synthetase [Deltaproteobacteria bacterium]MBW2515249.1 glutamine synthetase [Deltaproteobacteria bacterium]
MHSDEKQTRNETLKKTLTDAHIKFVRILWCDNANLIRAKAAHINYLDDYIKNGVGITMAQQALPVMYDSVVPETGLGPVGEVRLMPDWSTMTVLPYAEGHAQVLSDMVISETGQVWEHCPRGFLRKQVQKLERQGLVIQAVFENEFFLLRRSVDGALEPVDATVFSATGSMNQNQTFINALADALIAQGVEVEGYYPESGPGQQELNIRYAEAMQSADRQIIYRETVRGMANLHGLIGSFLPKIFEDKAGSGCHLNFSLWHQAKNISGDPQQANGISSEAGAFIAGLLDHLPALCALTIPSKNSYRRIRPHCWAGAFRTWGTQNREAAVRICKDPKGTRASRIEYKISDATANPYVALGSLIAAGLDGLQRNLKLPEEVTLDPSLIPEADRTARGIDQLPQNLGEALEALRKDDVLLRALGEGLARSYIAVRQNEWEALKDMSLEEEVDLLAERY